MLKRLYYSLAAKSIALLSTVTFLILFIITAKNIFDQNSFFLKNRLDQVNGFSQLVLSAMRYPMLNGDQDVIQKQFENYRGLKDLETIHLLDDRGIIKRSIEPERIGQRSLSSGLEQVLSGKEVHGFERRQVNGKDVFSKLLPIKNEKACYSCHGSDKKVLGALRLAYNWEPVRTETGNIWRRTVILSLLGLLGMIALIGVSLFRMIIRPLKKLEAGMGKAAQGDFTQRIHTASRDEIGRVTGMFNTMAEDLGLLVQKEHERNEELSVLNESLSREIGEREKAESQLVSTSRRLADIIDFLPDATFVIDSNKKIIAWNRAIEEMSGVKKERMLGKGEKEYREIFYGSDRPLMIDLLVDGYKATGDRQETVRVERFVPGLNSGQGLFVMGTASLLFDSKGVFAGAIESIRDISERKQAETKLKEAMETKSKFLSVVSHELRTPLTSIKEGINIVLDGSAGQINEEQKDFLDTAKRNVDRLARLINSVLDFQKLESGKMQFTFQDNDLNETVSEVHQGMKSMVLAKGLEFTLDLDPAAGRFNFDRDKIIQVVTNLVNNAAKFTEKGSIRVSTKRDGDSVFVRVDDTGPGLKPENLPLLFQSFQQFGDERVRKGGSGLGLAISKEIVERHLGKIWVESKLGEGCSFIFTLPLSRLQISLGEIVEREKEKVEAGWQFLLFCVRLESAGLLKRGYDAAKIESLMQRVTMSFQNVVGPKELVTMTETGQLIVFTQVLRNRVAELRRDLLTALKESICDLEDGITPEFSIAAKAYPDDAPTIRELLAGAQASMESEQASRLKKRIMVVDDDPNAVDVLRQFLLKFGYSDIVSTFSGREALASIAERVPDLLILDMQMPEMSGYEVIGRLKGDPKTKDMPVLIISGYEVMLDQIKHFFQKKAVPMIGKPFDKSLLEKWLLYLL